MNHSSSPNGSSAQPLVGVIMGSQSDWPTTMTHASRILTELDILHETKIVSAHRTPDRMHEYAKSAEQRGLKVIIAGAGGAAHLPGMVAGMTSLPVLGVPVQSKTLSGVDSLYSIVQMPPGVPTATFSIGKPGAINAALFAARVLAVENADLNQRLKQWIDAQAQSVPIDPVNETNSESVTPLRKQR